MPAVLLPLLQLSPASPCSARLEPMVCKHARTMFAQGGLRSLMAQRLSMWRKSEDWWVPLSTGLYCTVGITKQLRGIGKAVSFSNLVAA